MELKWLLVVYWTEAKFCFITKKIVNYFPILMLSQELLDDIKGACLFICLKLSKREIDFPKIVCWIFVYTYLKLFSMINKAAINWPNTWNREFETEKRKQIVVKDFWLCLRFNRISNVGLTTSLYSVANLQMHLYTYTIKLFRIVSRNTRKLSCIQSNDTE